MALSASVLSAAAKAELLANDPKIVDNDSLQELCDAFATAIVAHITGAAVIPAGIAVATTGTAAAQTGATTGTGTIT